MPGINRNPKHAPKLPASGRVDQRQTLLCAHAVEVQQGASRKSRQEGLLEEITLAGAVVSTPCPLRIGAVLRINCHTCELRGKVVWHQEGAGSYLSEIEFPVEQPWTPGQFMPDRLFNPRSMSCSKLGCRPDCVNQCCGETTAQQHPST